MQVNHSVKEGCCQNEIIHPKVKHSGKRIWGWFAPSRQLKCILQDNIRVASPLAEAVVEIGDATEKKKRTLKHKSKYTVKRKMLNLHIGQTEPRP